MRECSGNAWFEENKPYLYAWSINLGKFRIDKIKSRENMKSALSDFHVQFCSISSSSNWQFGGTLDRLVSIFDTLCNSSLIRTIVVG